MNRTTPSNPRLILLRSAPLGVLPPFQALMLFLLLLRPAALAAEGSPEAAEPAPSGETASGSEPEGESVTVQGKRPAASEQTDPSAASSTITRARLETPGASLANVLDQEAGVRVTAFGGLGDFALVSIRGSTPEQVLILLDGVPLNGGMEGFVDLSSLPLGHIERIEVYRGSSPILFGSQAMGGVINIVTHRPKGDLLEATAGGGSFGTRSARLLYGGAGERTDWVLGLDYLGSEGNFRFSNDGGTRFDPRDDRTETRTHNRFDAFGLLFRTRTRMGRARLQFVEVGYFRRRELPGSYQFAARKASLIQWRNLTFLTMDFDAPTDRPLRLSPTVAVRVDGLRLEDPDAEAGLGVKDTRDQMLSPQVGFGLDAKPASWLRWRGGLQYAYEKVWLEDLVGSARRPQPERHRAETALEATFSAAAISTDFISGVRLEVTRSSAEGGTAPDSSQAAPHSEWLPGARVGLVNRSVPSLEIRANAGRYTRSPTLFELFGDAGMVRGHAGLRAESGWNVDAGAVHEAAYLPEGFRLRLEGYVFYRRADDLIQFVQTSQNVLRAMNTDRARILGVETALGATLGGVFSLRSTYTCLDTRNDSRTLAHHGRRLPMQPRHQVFINPELGYRSSGTLSRLALFLEADYRSGYDLDSANLIRMPGGWLLSLGHTASFFEDRLTLRLVVRNVLNRQAYDTIGHPLPGRSYWMTMTWKVW